MRTKQEVAAEVAARLGGRSDAVALLDLHDSDEGLFYELGCMGVDENADESVRSLAALAMNFRSALVRGYRLSERGDALVVIPRGHAGVEVCFPAASALRARELLLRLEGVSVIDRPTKNLRGTPVSEAEVTYKLGERGSHGRLHADLAERSEKKPHVFRLDPGDVAALRSQPAYATYELTRCATKVLHTPSAAFEGLRRNGPLAKGRAWCGRLRWTYDEQGRRQPAPQDHVFLVYTTADNFVFDWDWVVADTNNPDLPRGWEARFTKRIQVPFADAVIEGVEDLRPGQFSAAAAAYSNRGDCVFFYFEEAAATARWIDDNLTEFTSIDGGRLVGCKLKNIKSILSDFVGTKQVEKILLPGSQSKVSATRVPLDRIVFESWSKAPGGVTSSTSLPLPDRVKAYADLIALLMRIGSAHVDVPSSPSTPRARRDTPPKSAPLTKPASSPKRAAAPTPPTRPR